MLEPGFALFFWALMVVAVYLYFIINKKIMSKWPDSMKIAFHFAFAVACIAVIWGIASFIITNFLK